MHYIFIDMSIISPACETHTRFHMFPLQSDSSSRTPSHSCISPTTHITHNYCNKCLCYSCFIIQIQLIFKRQQVLPVHCGVLQTSCLFLKISALKALDLFLLCFPSPITPIRPDQYGLI